MSREDQMGYDVMGSEDTIPEDGMGDITVRRGDVPRMDG